MQEIQRPYHVQTIQCFLILGGIVATVAAPLILFIEAFEWVFNREWPGLTLADGLSVFGIHHEAAETASQRALDVAMAAPLTVALFLTGLSMFLVGINRGNWDAERRLDRDLYEDPILSLALLVSGTEITFLSFLRIAVLDLILRFLFLLGSSGILAGLALYFAGIPSRWIVPAGSAMIIMWWLSRRCITRKLLHEASDLH